MRLKSTASSHSITKSCWQNTINWLTFRICIISEQLFYYYICIKILRKQRRIGQCHSRNIIETYPQFIGVISWDHTQICMQFCYYGRQKPTLKDSASFQ